MSDMLSIGATGVRAYQAALTTTSENIANAGTDGYSRRIAATREIIAPSSPASATMNGLGVSINGVARAVDMFRAGDVRTANSDLAKTETGATWLARIEGALTGNRLAEQLTSFFNAAKPIAADPAALPPRAAMLESAASLASAFNGTGTALAGALADLDATAENAARDLNQLAASLARVNVGIGRTPPGSSGSAALLDERDRLLESMSALTDISASFDESGRATVRGGGTGGPMLVVGDSAGVLTYVRNDEGAVSYAVYRDGKADTMVPNAGVLAGLHEGVQRITTAQRNFETLAADFVAGVNAFQQGGQDLAGSGGAPMFEAGDPAWKITLVLTDPRGIAAATPGGGTRDNGNLAALDTMRSGARTEARLTEMVTSNAAALTSRRTVSDAQTAIRDSAVAARDAVSGVNIDEEAVDLIRFQQAYQASSRVIQIARDTLQSILDIR